MMKGRYNYNLLGISIGVLVTEIAFWILFALVWIFIKALVPSFDLENPDWLWILAALPIMVFIFLIGITWKNRKLKKFSDSDLLGYLVPNISSVKTTMKFLLTRYGITFIIIGLANPQIGTKMEEARYEGVDLMIALDVSSSMLAEDLSPNRLERAKRAIEQLVDDLHGDRLGLIVFAGDAYVQLPITTDHNAAKLFLSTIDTDIVPVQGTSISSAIELAARSFDMDNGSGKAIIIITDGEDHEEGVETAAAKAVEQGIIVHTIGMGSDEGVPIPVYRGRKQIGFKKDKDGSTVITKLNESMLKTIAAEGKGIFVHASNSEVGLRGLLQELRKMDAQELGTLVYSDHEDRFQFFLAAGLLLLFVDLKIGKKKSRWVKELKLFDSV